MHWPLPSYWPRVQAFPFLGFAKCKDSQGQKVKLFSLGQISFVFVCIYKTRKKSWTGLAGRSPGAMPSQPRGSPAYVYRECNATYYLQCNILSAMQRIICLPGMQCNIVSAMQHIICLPRMQCNILYVYRECNATYYLQCSVLSAMQHTYYSMFTGNAMQHIIYNATYHI